MSAGHEDASGQRQAGIFRQRDGLRGGCGYGHWLGAHPRCGQPQVSVTGQFPCTLAGTFGESAFVVGLDPPRDAFDEPRAVPGSCLVSADVGKLCSQLLDRHSLQRSDLLCQSLELGFNDLKLRLTVMQLGFTVIPAQAGIQIASLVSRLRGNNVTPKLRFDKALACHIQRHVFAPFYWRLGTLNRADH